MKNNVFSDDFAKRAFIQEECGKLIQFIKRYIGGICPIESEFIATVRVVGKIARIYSIGDNE